MKRNVTIVTVSLLAVLSLMMASCSGGETHQHTWSKSTCTEPRVCTECGEVGWEAPGHSWVSATCTEPKTCRNCGETEGEALGHKWVEATCTAPKTCSVCKETEGAAAGHIWTEATCDIAKTCSTCGLTEGDPLGHDAPEVSCVDSGTCSRCGETVDAWGHTYSEATCTEAAVCSVCGEEVEAALGHTVSSGVCDRCGAEIYDWVSGYGDDVVSDVQVGDGLYRIRFTNDGSRNFIVRAYDADDDKDLLVNTIGSYDGSVLLLGKAPYSFEIKSSGSWSYKIERIGDTDESSFSGTGDHVTDKFSASTGSWQFTHDGSHNFIVRAVTTKGLTTVVNEIGPYDGKVRVDVPSGSGLAFVVVADGSWTASPVE